MGLLKSKITKTFLSILYLRSSRRKSGKIVCPSREGQTEHRACMDADINKVCEERSDVTIHLEFQMDGHALRPGLAMTNR